MMELELQVILKSDSEEKICRGMERSSYHWSLRLVHQCVLEVDVEVRNSWNVSRIP